MVCSVKTVAFRGMDIIPVEVQVHMAGGLPAFSVVGLADKSITESRERVRAALNSLGLSLPPKRITVNLAPADVQKEGSHFDLPIALALLAEMEAIPRDALDNYIALGEISLNGEITFVTGVLPAAIHARAQNLGVICPHANGAEAAWAGEFPILAPSHLLSAIQHFKGERILEAPRYTIDTTPFSYPDMRHIEGQQAARRALEIAAAGGHNMLMSGPPGSGKSMLAAALPGLLPELTAQETLEVSMIQSVAGQLASGALSNRRPFRDPHHSCSMPAMVGGGTKALPGEITLAHHGVLFLDELPEFSRQVLDALRQPLETGQVSIARAQSHVTYPARFQLIAAMNPCRCGYLDDPAQACSRAPKCGDEYQNKLSGPLLDRIDIHIEVPRVRVQVNEKFSSGESSHAIAARVSASRAKQQRRYRENAVKLNAHVSLEALLQEAPLEQNNRALIEKLVDQAGLSMRGYHRLLRVARTIADLDGSESIQNEHILEAYGYRKISYRSQIDKIRKETVS